MAKIIGVDSGVGAVANVHSSNGILCVVSGISGELIVEKDSFPYLWMFPPLLEYH